MSDVFVTTYGETDFGALVQEARELLESRFPGWEASRSDALDWLLQGTSSLNAPLFVQFSSLEKALFQRFGEVITKVPRIQAASATVESVWTMVDELGHEVEAGTEVGIPGPEGKPVGFRTVGDVVVAPGSNKATILLEAIEPGAAGNELGGGAELETNLSFVVVPEGIELIGESAGGVDEEGQGEYLDRLVKRNRLSSVSLIVPYDFEVDALDYGVGRAKCIRGYDPTAGTTGHAGHQCLFPAGVDGLEVGAEMEAEILAGQSELLLEGVTHHVAPPQYTTVRVKAVVVAEAGFEPTAIAAAVKARIAEFLDPAKWATPANGEGNGWVDRLSVFHNDLVVLIGRMGGVEHVSSVELAEEGKGLGTADVALKGVAALTKPGKIEVSVS